MKEELSSYIIISMLFSILVYLTGIYFHLKVIKISKKEKDMTWKLDVTNSCLLLTHHGHCVAMECITYIIHDLHHYTGEWFCYTSKVFNFYGNLYTTGHSLIVSTLKYILIVHWKRVRSFGQEQVKEIFFWINFIYAAIMILFHLIIRPDFFVIYDGYARVDRCLGDPKNNWGPDSNRTQVKLHTICTLFIEPSHEDYLAYTIYVLKIFGCWMEFIFEYLVNWNVFEIVMYWRIFSFMRR